MWGQSEKGVWDLENAYVMFKFSLKVAEGRGGQVKSVHCCIRGGKPGKAGKITRRVGVGNLTMKMETAPLCHKLPTHAQGIAPNRNLKLSKSCCISFPPSTPISFFVSLAGSVGT